MAHAFLETFAVGMDSQTAVAVQSLLESQTIPEPVQGTAEEDDVFQCGKCKRQFSTLGAFINHKQSRCLPQRQILASSGQNVMNQNSLLQAVNRHPQIMQAPAMQAATLPAYTTVPPSPLTQNMVLTDELMSFASVDQTLGASTIQLQQGAALQANGPLLSQVASFNPRTSNVAIFNTINATSALPSSGSAFTSTVSTSQVPLQNVMFTALTEKPIAPTVAKPSPTKAGRKSAQANLVNNVAAGEDPTSIRARRGKPADPEEKKKLRCRYCDKAFSKNFDLQQHIRAHTGEKPFQCIVCGRAFAQKSNVKKHMSTHKVWPTGNGSTLPSTTQIVEVSAETEEQPTTTVTATTPEDPEQEDKNEEEKNKKIVMVDNSYICQYCNEKFKSYFHLKTHMVKHKSEQVYKCVQKSCNSSFKELDAFLQHVKTHESEMQYRCHLCNKFFQSLYELGVHQYTHSLYPNHSVKAGPRHFQCTKCMNKYSSPEALEHHMATSSHSHPCPHCDKVFTCERYLRRHLPSHGSEGQFQCHICQKRLKAEHYLKQHLLIHSGEKPFACTTCGASFNRKDKLKRHMTIHDTTKRFRCPFKSITGCDKEFNRADKLKAHIITHSGVRPYECDICGKTFSRRPHLNEHKRGHLADYKYNCSSCGKGFWRPKTFKDHKCQPLKPGQTRIYVHRQRNRRKVGRPKKRMITVTKETITKAAENNSRKRRSTSRTVVNESESVATDSQSMFVMDGEGAFENAENQESVNDSNAIVKTTQEEHHIVTSNRMIDSDITSVDKQDFCVKVIPPEGLLNQHYVTVHIQNPNTGQSDIQTHLFPTSSSQVLSSSAMQLPITIIETQPGTILPVQVAAVEGASDGNALPLQVTAMSGMGGHENMASGISVEELVPVHVTLPVDDGTSVVATHVVVSSSGQLHQSTYVNQLEDYGVTEGDPVLQGRESLLKAHAEILQSAQQQNNL